MISKCCKPAALNSALLHIDYHVSMQHEYMNYMQKKTSRRQTTIITLSDQNQKEIYDMMQDKQDMLDEYEDKKNGQLIGKFDICKVC